LPDLRNNGSGLTSSLYIRNNGAEPRDTNITFNNSSGTPVAVATKVALQPNALWLPTPPPNWQGSAIVNGGESLVATVRNNGSGISTLDTGSVPGGSGDLAFEVAATTLYGPVAYNNIFGGLNSTIYVQNTSKDTNSITVNFYGRAGYGNYAGGLTLNGNGSGTLSTSAVMGSTPWVGSIRITADQPVAAKIYESQGSTTSRTYGAAAGGKSLMYVPAAYKNQFGLSTGLVIQNLHNINATNTITVTYCDRDNTVCSQEPTFALNAQRAVGINVGTTSALPAMWTGSIKIESKGGIPLGIVVTNANTSGGYDVNGNNFGSKVVTLPWATYDPNNGRTTGYTLRNVSGQNNVTVIAKYYDIAGGNPVWTRTINPVNSAQVKGFFQNTDTLPVGWQGSIVLESTGNIVAIMREDTSTTLGGYNGVPR